MTSQARTTAASSQPSAVAWQVTFADLCRSMMARQQVAGIGPHQQGVISWEPTRQCPKCSTSGVYYGLGLCYKLHADMDAYFCTTCCEVSEVRTTFPFAVGQPETFLPIMHQRLKANPDFLVETHEFGACTECDGQRRTIMLSPPEFPGKTSHMLFTCTGSSCKYGEIISEDPPRINV